MQRDDLAPSSIVDLADVARVGDLVDTVRATMAADVVAHAPARDRVELEVQRAAPLLSPDHVSTIAGAVLDRFGGLAPLRSLFDDASVTEIMVNDSEVWFERAGRLIRSTVRLDSDAISRMIEEIVVPLDRRIDRSSPLVDARLPDGSRVNIVIPPLAADGPCITIRRFRTRAIGLHEFADGGVVDLLTDAVRQRANIVVSGGTGSGKTTLLNALGATILAGERIVTIEDTAELDLGLDHVVRLEARDANAEGVGRVDTRMLLRNALRMRPDRILVGEVRGAEVLDMLQAMNTGHEGSLSTCHANSPRDALRRLETMCLLGPDAVPVAVARDLVSASVDLVVQVGRLAGGARGVRSVLEVLDVEDWSRPGGTRLVAVDRGFAARWVVRQGAGDD